MFHAHPVKAKARWPKRLALAGFLLGIIQVTSAFVWNPPIELAGIGFLILVSPLVGPILGAFAGATLERGRSARVASAATAWAAFGGFAFLTAGLVAGMIVATSLGVSAERGVYLIFGWESPSDVDRWTGGGYVVGAILGLLVGATTGAILVRSSSRSWFFAPLAGALLLALPGAIIGGSLVGPPDSQALRSAAALGAALGALAGSLIGLSGWVIWRARVRARTRVDEP